MRLHSLPDSQRYAGDEAEYEIVLNRHRVVLEKLTVAASASLRWIYSPYDGGADVFADPEVIAQLRTEHAEWLAPV